MADRTTAAFGREVRTVREERGMSQDALSHATGIHSTAIGRIERGGREPRLGTILALADGLGVPPGRLLDQITSRGT